MEIPNRTRDAPGAGASGQPSNGSNLDGAASSLSREPTDALARLKAYATSGQDLQALAANAASAHSDNGSREPAATPSEVAGAALPTDGSSNVPRTVQIGTPSVILSPAPEAGFSAAAASDPVPVPPIPTNAPTSPTPSAEPNADRSTIEPRAIAGLKPSTDAEPVARPNSVDAAGPTSPNSPALATPAPLTAGVAPAAPTRASTRGGRGTASAAAVPFAVRRQRSP